MSTGREIINDSLMDIGVGVLGEDVEQSVINHGLRVLNRMLSSWSAQIGPVYASTLDTHTWTAGSASQTIGSGGDIDTVRPILITGFQMRVGNIDYTLDPITYEEYQEINIKDLESNYPYAYAYQRGYPLGTLYIDFEPASNITARIQSKKALTAATLDAELSLPDGYELAIQSNLTVLLAAAHGKQPKPETTLTAANTKTAIEQINEDHKELIPDSMCPIYNNYYGEDIDRLTNK